MLHPNQPTKKQRRGKDRKGKKGNTKQLRTTQKMILVRKCKYPAINQFQSIYYQIT